MSFLDALIAAAVPPPPEISRWYCDRKDCNGEPHGEHWHWCEHPLAGPHEQSCRHARGAQCPPEGDWGIWLLMSGRGFGKSRAAAEWLIREAWNSEPAEWAVVARSSGDVRKNARDMNAGLVKVAGSRIAQYNRHEEYIRLSNGAVIYLLSADKPDKLRGYNLAGAWVDELCTWRFPDAWDMLRMATRVAGANARIVVTTTPRPMKLIKQLVEQSRSKDGFVVLTSGRTRDNAANLSPGFVAQLEASYAGTRRGRQELDGELIFDADGALVSDAMIEDGRLPASVPDGLARIVVAVDPATSYGESADETGIVVCAKGADGHGYVLDDLSCKKKSPKEWATIAVAAYERYQADRIVAEKNQGGAMVEETIRSIAPFVPYTGVTATVSKRLRAEPVTALYEQGRIHHCGVFPELEAQLVTWEPDSKMSSPDRMDALVHGMTELGLARWGQGHVFLEHWRRDIAERTERDGTGKPSAAEQRRRRIEAVRARRVRECTHLWRTSPSGTRCVHCDQPAA